MWISSFPSVRMHCLLHENATRSAEVLTDTGRKTGSLVHGCTRQDPPYMDVCRLRSRRNSCVSIPVSANTLQTQAFSRQTGNLSGRLEYCTDAHHRSYFFEKSLYLVTAFIISINTTGTRISPAAVRYKPTGRYIS